MKRPPVLPVLLLLLFLTGTTHAADESADLAEIKREVAELRRRVTRLEEANTQLRQQIVTERLIVKRELIVSDTEAPWERGFEAAQIPRGLYAKPVGEGVGGLWVRSRLIKGEIDDPFDDRFHALERSGGRRGAPGHISWNLWLDDAWRQLAIIQGEALEESEMNGEAWSGGNHPGRLRFQTYRPRHDEPLTDAVLGQGRMSLGGGGFGGGGLPYPKSTLHLWGGRVIQEKLSPPEAPEVTADDGSGDHTYALVAVDAEGQRSAPSPAVKVKGLARLRWGSVNGADAYIILRDGAEITGPLRMEGARKEWTDSR